MYRSVYLVVALVLAVPLATFGDDFPQPYNTEPDQSGPMSPSAAAAGFKMPADFRVQVFASEPEVQNPIAMAWDARGRLWIAENYTYAERKLKFESGLRDRVLIFSDLDGDGRADRRQVFTDDVQRLSSIAIGRGGVWLMCPPQLLFFPDGNRDDLPDGPARVLLDGFSVPTDNYHTFANGLKWGLDGWLYGRCGASSAGRIGVPGTPDAERIPIHGGLWRFHPQRKVFEVLAHGTTNPWGHDWNEYGEPFYINTVNGHLWHAFTGAHFRRPHTQDPNPRVYDVIGTHADHWHWDTGQDWMDSRGGAGAHGELGGGHAHSGCMIYLADQLPPAYRGQLFTLNLHGRRINVDRLERSGSGYVGRHEPDLFQATDTWFRGIELGYGPDGGIYVLDWSDAGECHEHDGVHRTSGRIYKVTFGAAKPTGQFDLFERSPLELVDLHSHANEWFVRQARRILVDRAQSGQDLSEVRDILRGKYDNEWRIPQKLRFLWTLYSIGGTDSEFERQQLSHDNEHIRAWGVRLLTDHWPLDTILSDRPVHRGVPDPDDLTALNNLAEGEPSGLVRLMLSSTLQRLPIPDRTELAQALSGRAKDALDHNLPLLLWYGLIPVADNHPELLVRLAGAARIPTLQRFISRRLAEEIEDAPGPVDMLLELALQESAEFQTNVLMGLADGLTGWRKAPQPRNWELLRARMEPSATPQVQAVLRELRVLFGDGRALDEVKQIALNAEADLRARRAALETLISNRPDDLRTICESLLGVRFLNTIALRGLALVDDPAIGRQLARSYRRFHHSERDAVIEALVSRPQFAGALLEQMAKGNIPRTALSAFQARQIRSFDEPQLSQQLSSVWGNVREAAEDKREAIARLKTRLTSAALMAADKGNGRRVFNTACANCHRLYGRGGTVGPDLTGSGRQNLDYLLDNLIDPSAVVSADFRMSVLTTTDGRVLNGIVLRQTDKTLTLHTAKEEVTVPRMEIETLQPSTLSVMPDGLLETLSETQIDDLIAYLMYPTQVALPAETSAAIGSQ